MPSPVLHIRMPVADLKLLMDEASKRGKEPSVLAREILRECLSGPGVATVGRTAARKAALQQAERKPRKDAAPAKTSPDLIKSLSILEKYEGPKQGGSYKEKELSLSDRLRQMRS